MEKIEINSQSETLLITLYARVLESRKANPIIRDPKAEEIADRVDYDFTGLKVPTGTRITTCFRATRFDRYTKAFLEQNPKGSVIQLGCGLDSRYERVSVDMDLSGNRWYELDLPDAMALRRKFYTETKNRKFIESSVTEHSWMDNIEPKEGPVLVIAEGLFMYLQEQEVKALILALKNRFRDCRLSFDCFSAYTVKKIKNHPSVKKVGAKIFWGIDDAAELEKWDEGISLEEEWYFTQAPEIARLSTGMRLGFKLAGAFKVARIAQRVLCYKLTGSAY